MLARCFQQSSEWECTYLWCEVESEVAVIRQLVLDKQRHLVAQAESHTVTETSSLAEVDEVLEREGKSDRLRERDVHTLGFVLHVGVLAEGD
jgi:hypothetical protein